MSFRTTVVLFAVLLAAVAGLLVYSQLETDDPTGGGLIADFAAGIKESDVDTIEITRTQPAEEKLVFVRTGAAQWELRQPTAAKADGAAVETVLRAVWTAKPTPYRGLTRNLTTHGLAAPTFTVALKSKGTKSVAVNFGDTTIGGSEATTFVTTGDRPDVPVAVRTADLRTLFREGQSAAEGAAAPKAKWLGDYRAKRLFNVEATNPGADLASIKLSQGPAAVALARTAEGNWRFEQPANFGDADIAGDATPRSDFFTGVRPLLNLLVSLQAASAADFIENVPAGDLAKYGLAAGDPTAIRVELKPKGDAPPEVVFLGKAVEGATPTQTYCRRENDSAVIRVTTDRTALLASTIKNPGELRNRDFIAEGRKELIDALDIVVKGEAFRLRRTGSGPAAAWKAFGGPEPRDANKAAVQALIDALAKPRAALAILPSPNLNAFNAPEVQGELKVWFAGQEKKEGETTEPKMKGDADAAFTVGRVDADGSFFRRTVKGETTDYKIAADLVAAFTKRRLDYVAAPVARFGPFDATALTLTRGAETFEVKKTSPANDPDLRWNFEKPEPSKGTSADTEAIQKILGVLGSYQAGKIVADAPDAEALKKFGLDAPRVKAAVTVAGSDKPREYLFGGESEDKSVYVKLADAPFVLLAPKEMLDPLATADLRDRVIFRTDPAKVTKVVLSGWKAPPDNTVKRVTLESKGGAWVSDAPGITIDEAKLKSLLGALRAPRLTDFVAGLDPVAMGLGGDNGSLQIMVHQAGVPEPVWIDLSSKEEAGKPGIYATSSGVKNVVFKVDGAYFRQLVLDPKALQK